MLDVHAEAAGCWDPQRQGNVRPFRERLFPCLRRRRLLEARAVRARARLRRRYLEAASYGEARRVLTLMMLSEFGR